MTSEAAPPGSWPASDFQRELSLPSCGTCLTDTFHSLSPTAELTLSLPPRKEVPLVRPHFCCHGPAPTLAPLLGLWGVVSSISCASHPGHGTYFLKHTPHTGTSVTSAMRSLSRKVAGWVCGTGNVKSLWDLHFGGGEVAAVLILGSTDYDGSVGLLRETFATSPKARRVLRGRGITQSPGVQTRPVLHRPSPDEVCAHTAHNTVEHTEAVSWKECLQIMK